MIFLSPILRLMLVAIIILPLTTKAQTEPSRCGTAELMRLHLEQNPGLAHALQQQEEAIAHWVKQHRDHPVRNVITIPVVVHLVYNPAVNTVLTDWQVKDQIDILNEDYRRLNADTYKTPSDFAGVARDTEIQFCLARQDPNGNFTTGILRETYTDVSEWDMGSFNTYKQTAWPYEQYLNVWVAYMPGQVLGWSTFPGTNNFTDGVVVADRAFSRVEPASGNYNRGRTTTHEIGHWLSLHHVSGDDSGCNGTDFCDDTPNQAGDNTGCPTHPKVSCNNNGDMFMNFMDYVRDSCMNLFTDCQRLRMHAAVNTQRTSLLSSPACTSPLALGHDIAVTDILYPFLTVTERYINPVVRVRNNGTNPVNSFTLQYRFYKQQEHTLHWTGLLAPGTDTVLTLPQLLDSTGYNFFMAYVRNLNGGVTELDTVNNFMSRSFFVSPDAFKPENTMRVLGNPSNGTFILEFEILINDGFEIEVFNVLGQRVRHRGANPVLNRLEITLPDAAPGTYFVRVLNNRKKLSAKLLVLPMS